MAKSQKECYGAHPLIQANENKREIPFRLGPDFSASVVLLTQPQSAAAKQLARAELLTLCGSENYRSTIQIVIRSSRSLVRRRRHARMTPQANTIPGIPAPTIGPGTLSSWPLKLASAPPVPVY